MPRPTEEKATTSNNSGWWTNTRLERVLIGVTIVGVTTVIVLLVLVAKKQADFTAKFCSTPICLSEASRINDYIDPSINPCDDFYHFACGNFLKNAHGDEDLALGPVLQAQGERELFEAYVEPIQEGDHKMVKTAKKLFRACMNTTAIDLDGLDTIKAAVKAVGGWPVVEGSAWDEASFDWVTATYKLRELGYHYSIFLELQLQDDPEDETRHIFEVVTPYMWDYSFRNIDKVKFMTDVAVLFGAADQIKASEEMATAQAFLVQLQTEVHNQYGRGTSKSKFTVKDYSQKCKSINWLHFINTLSGVAAHITEDDHVIFPPPESLNKWTELLAQTPRRIQANYMMWKVVEAAFPYLSTGRLKLDDRRKKLKDRKAFCLSEVQERFTPSPLDVVCDRKFLPKAKKKLVEDLATTIKTELAEEIRKLNWMEDTDKEQTAEEANTAQLVIAQPGDYFEDQVLDDEDVDLVETKSSTFLSLLAQANRNHHSERYRLITKSPLDNLYGRWYILAQSTPAFYDVANHLLYIPAVSAGDALYNELRPNYLNYGALGTQIATPYSAVFSKHMKGQATYAGQASGWSNHTRQTGNKKLSCIEDEVKGYNLRSIHIDNVVLLRLGNEITRSAYEKFVQKHGEEQHLIGVDYTPRQLFWISSMSGFCRPINPYGPTARVFPDERASADIFAGSMRNNPDFAQDFGCPAGTKMNPSKKCRILS